MRLRQHLVVFARWPTLGSGKRRLSKDIGAVEALRFQRSTLALMLRRLGADRRWITWLAVTPDRSGPWPSRFRLLPQGTGDLGRRMAAVARKLPPGPVVLVGSDIPELLPAISPAPSASLGVETQSSAQRPTVAIGSSVCVGVRVFSISLGTYAGRPRTRSPTLCLISSGKTLRCCACFPTSTMVRRCCATSGGRFILTAVAARSLADYSWFI